MFQSKRKPQSAFGSALSMLEVVYHCVVRSVRSRHNNAFMAIGLNMMQAVMFVAMFYAIFSLLGMRGAALRGDFLLYIMSGVFMYLSHIRAITSVMAADGPTSSMMMHAPMTTIISIVGTALSALYVQTTTLLLILFIYHMLWTPVYIVDPAAAYGMFLLAWFTGCCFGLLLLSIKPWFPQTVQVVQMVYMRVNMFASGKMFVANALPAFMVSMFDWNPLFHIIDQSRGFVFENYFPRNSSWEYALAVGCGILAIGMMSEFYTRQHASASWDARR